MFERRLKILLGVILVFTLVLILRAGWLQIVQADQWRSRAADAGRRSSWVETTRGRILDFRGREVAVDAPCVDAAVDYRAIDVEAPESQEWLRAQAKARLVARGAIKGDREERTKLIDAEMKNLGNDLREMWDLLAEVSGKPREEIEEIKQTIIKRVQFRRRYLWYRKFEEASDRHVEESRAQKEKKETASKWYAWLIDENQPAPQLDSFKVTVSEQTESHVVLRAVDNETYIRLDKMREKCPGLELRKSTHRFYPYYDVACHVIGNLTSVGKKDIAEDPNLTSDESRKYFPNDLTGRTGIERLAEQTLRGARGQIVRQLGRDSVVENTPPKSGQDVRITIDMELQMRIQEAFMRYKEEIDPARKTPDLRLEKTPVHVMHGGAVVIDVPTGQVRAMISYPTFNLNEFDTLYPSMVKNTIDRPMMNRATQAALEPGSTAKPMVGLAAITAGLVKVGEGIECTGYLQFNGRQMRDGKCWVATKLAHLNINVAHHPVPYDAPHPTGFLNFADALERSCNVYFENCADRLKLEGLQYWYREFGLGQVTGVGIAEVPGQIPNPELAINPRSAAWFSGIGQSQVLATPIQMANAAATMARRGVAVRPHLLTQGSEDHPRRDMKLAPAALDAMNDGMVRVVNSRAGTGKILKRTDMLVAGKTGTAQARQFSIVLTDEQGKPKLDEKGRYVRRYFEPSTPDNPNVEMPWYRGSGNSGTDLSHGWMIGFAPADNPQIAFAVMVEYGGSGGANAGPIAQTLLEACVTHGYLQPTK